MEHTKKMVLVPQESLQFTQTVQPTVQTPGDPLTRLDNEMGNILTSNAKDDKEKWLKFQQLFSRFLQTMPTKQRSQQPAEQNSLLDDDAADERQETIRNGLAITDESIINSVPKLYRGIAENLIRDLKKVNGDKFRWDDTGTVYINGSRIRDSHIIDLINDVMRKRKNVKSVGRKSFAGLLKEVSVPKLYLGNPDFWEPATIKEPITTQDAHGPISPEEDGAGGDENTRVDTPLVKRLRKQIREEKRQTSREILLPYAKVHPASAIKTPWSYMQLRERKTTRRNATTNLKKKPKRI